MTSRPTAEEILSQVKAEEEQAEEEHRRAEEARVEYSQLRDAFRSAGVNCLQYRLEEELGRKATLDEFCAYWAERVVELGRVLVEKGLAYRFDELAPVSRAKMYALEILRRGIEGRTEEVTRLLRDVSERPFGGEVSEWLRGRLEGEILQYKTLAVTGADGICRPVFQEFEVAEHPSDVSEVPDDPELHLQRNWPLNEAAREELVEWSKRLRDWKRRGNAAGRNPSPSEYSALTEERRQLEADLYEFNLQYGPDLLARFRRECQDAYRILDLLALTPLGQASGQGRVDQIWSLMRQLVIAGLATAPPEMPSIQGIDDAKKAVDLALRWGEKLSPQANPTAEEAAEETPKPDKQEAIQSQKYPTDPACSVRDNQTPQNPQSRRMTVSEANDEAMRLAKADRFFVQRSLREWAEAIGCSEGLVAKLPLWRKTMKQTGRGRENKDSLPKVSFR
jgi:hypothetical protein